MVSKSTGMNRQDAKNAKKRMRNREYFILLRILLAFLASWRY
jgi:hypothetical protein